MKKINKFCPLKQQSWSEINPIILMVFVFTFAYSCKKDDNNPNLSIPVLTTSSITDITQTSANCGGNISSIGRTNVTYRGVCWSKGESPTVADSKTTDSADNGGFISKITGLIPNTTYYIRAYATNSYGTGYGKAFSFTTLQEINSTVTDIEGNVYKTVIIGKQIWMAENLKTTKYRNGDLIGTTSSANLDISGESTPKYQWSYDGNESNVAAHGRLYTWYAVTDNRNICPSGWHIPTDAEWTALTDYLEGELVAGDKLKETGTTHFNPPNSGATNESGFTALPGGYRYSTGTFNFLGNYGYWWSASESSTGSSWYRNVYYNYNNVYRQHNIKKIGFSVRCIKD